MSNEQKLREALLSDMDIAVLRMPVHLAFAGNMAQFQYHNRVQALLDRIEALATPTAEQVDDINVAESFTSVTKTAPPVGEREAFKAWLGITPCGAAHDYGWAAWQARAALSAGDAVDAHRYRWLMHNCTLGIKQNGVGWSLNTTACIAPDCIKDVGAAIDAAMRKGQL